jgi:16S rRNA (uracil1498-N3)-methyltransferase
MQLFYAPDIAQNELYILSHEESAHCTGVLRFSSGQDIILTDGMGLFYKACIESIEKKQVIVTIKSKEQITKQRNYYLHIAMAPTKSIDRFEWFLEKATEIGIDEITPLISENSERSTLRLDRMERVMVAAMKQSYKAYLPRINPMVSYQRFIENDHPDTQLFIASCADGDRRLLQNVYLKSKNALILIGPEGDFTGHEIEQAKTLGYISVSLGNSRLRTETAGIAASHTFYLLNNL